MALTTQTSDYPTQLCRELQRVGAPHLDRLVREYDFNSWRTRWYWRTKSGNRGDFETADTEPTPAELTALFVAIKLTD